MSSFLGGGGGGSSGGRTILTAAGNRYIATTGSDSNDGLTPATAWATLQHAMNVVATTLDMAGFPVTANIGAGSFAGFGAKACVGGGILQFNGAGSASTTITAGPADGIYNFGECADINVLAGIVLGINSVTFLPAAGTPGVAFYAAGQFFLLGDAITDGAIPVDIVFDCSNSPNCMIGPQGPGGLIEVFVGTVHIKPGGGTIGNFVLCQQGGQFAEISVTWVVDAGNLTVTDAWTGLQQSIYFTQFTGGFTVNGTVTGLRFDLTQGSSVRSGPIETYFPGSAAGIADASSSYNNLQGPLPGFTTQTANYTLALTDSEARVEMNLAGANTVTVPANASIAFPVGTRVRVTQVGAGATTVQGDVGVTVHNSGTIAAQWNSALLYKRGTDEWVMTL